MTEEQEHSLFTQACDELGCNYAAYDMEQLFGIIDAAGKSAVERLRTVLGLLIEYEQMFVEKRAGIDVFIALLKRDRRQDNRQHSLRLRAALAKLFGDAAEEMKADGDEESANVFYAEAARLMPSAADDHQTH